MEFKKALELMKQGMKMKLPSCDSNVLGGR